jgi:pimeloyl-ACP methyl ester carboxylesterase
VLSNPARLNEKKENRTMKTNYILIALVLIAALLLVGCGSEDTPVPAVPDGAQAGDLTELEACEFNGTSSKTKYAAECSTLVVPENWDKPGSRLIALPVMRIPARGANPAEPVFYLIGGPGLRNRPWALPDWLLEDHDVVAVGYRGVDGAVVLECPEVKRLFKAHEGKDVYSEEARAEYVAATSQCAATHQAAGIDLSGYTVPGIVEDMEAARKAMGYDRINLYSLSFGTRTAQIYAYMHPDSLRRLVLIGVATPGSMLTEPAELDEMIEYIGELCAKDTACSSRTDDFARTMYEVNRNMPERWLFFKIDPATIRLSIQMFMQQSEYMPMAFDAYLAAAEGDPSGLAMLNLIAKLMPHVQVFGDQINKIGTLDKEKYGGIESISLGESILGSPMAEAIWPAMEGWPFELVSKELREFQATDVEMLLVNGTVDVSTLPGWLDEASTYFHKAQIVRLPEFGHTGDVQTFQPEALRQLVTSYYDTGVADDSLFVYQPLSFEPDMRLPVIARLLVAGMIVLPALLILGIVLVVRRTLRGRRRAIES